MGLLLLDCSQVYGSSPKSSFIAKVNSIHLKQVERDAAESKEVESSDSGAQKAPEN